MPNDWDDQIRRQCRHLDDETKRVVCCFLAALIHGLELPFSDSYLKLLTRMVGRDKAACRLLNEFKKLNEDEKHVFGELLTSFNLRGAISTLPYYQHLIAEKAGRDDAAAIAAEFFLGSFLAVRMASAEGHPVESRETFSTFREIHQLNRGSTVAKAVFMIIDALMPK